MNRFKMCPFCWLGFFGPGLRTGGHKKSSLWLKLEVKKQNRKPNYKLTRPCRSLQDNRRTQQGIRGDNTLSTAPPAAASQPNNASVASGDGVTRQTRPFGPFEAALQPWQNFEVDMSAGLGGQGGLSGIAGLLGGSGSGGDTTFEIVRPVQSHPGNDPPFFFDDNLPFDASPASPRDYSEGGSTNNVRNSQADNSTTGSVAAPAATGMVIRTVQ